MTLCLTALLLAASVTVTPSEVPAKGHQEVVVASDQPGMVHIETTGSSGVSCSVVDQLRGPFATGGRTGHARCSLDLLMDASRYKVRLDAPSKGKGQLSVKATVFKEIRPDTPALDFGASADLQLHHGEQASFWVRLNTRRFVTLRVVGRTAGRIELWRDGRWREESEAYDTAPMPTPGQPLHEWWITRFLEAGEYLLTVYGLDEKQWSVGTESDAVTVANGFTLASDARNESLTLPASGIAGFTLPTGYANALLSLASAASTPTTLSLYALGDDDTLNIRGGAAASCTVQPRVRVPECAAGPTRSNKRHVVLIRGAPGTVARLQWAVFANEEFGDGSYGLGSDIYFTVPKSGRYLVGTTDLPPDADAPPLSCVLWEKPRDERTLLAGSDLVEISPQKGFQRSLNFTNNSTIWFHVTEGSEYVLQSSGEYATSCELYRVEAAVTRRINKSDTGSKRCFLRSVLQPGEYRIDFYGDKPGIEKIRIGGSGMPDKDTATKSGCLIQDVALRSDSRYELLLSRNGAVEARGFILRSATESLPAPLTLTLDGGRYVRVPIGAGRPVEVLVPTGAISCGMANGRPVDSAEGVCRPEKSDAGGLLVITPKSEEPVQVVVVRTPPPAVTSVLKGYSPNIVSPPTLPVDEARFFDFDRNESHSLVFDVKQAGLYDVTTEGLLATECTMRTAVVTALGSNAGGGRGRNCLLESYLRPGQYLVTAKTTGQSKGRASIVLRKRPPRIVAPVVADGDAFFRADEGELIQQQLTVKKSGPMRLSTTDRGIANQCRLEDADGWPLLAVPSSCTQQLELKKGTYLWTQLPLTVESMRHTRLEAVQPPKVFSGKKVHAVVFNEWSDAALRKSGKDEFFINLQAETDLTIALTNRMQGRLYLINPDKSLKPIDVIPPVGGGEVPQASPLPSDSEQEAPSEGMEGGDEPAPAMNEGEYEGEREYEGDGDGEAPPSEDYVPPRRTPPAPQYLAPVAPGRLPEGHVVHLPAGPYKLITEHSQGDVNIRYRLFVGTDSMIPGVTRTLSAPTFLTVRVPADGTVRLTTTGETDVRCRVFDAAGHLVTESDHNGEDWNCAFAEPMAKGDYRLVIESETLIAGDTRVSFTMPTVKDIGTLASGPPLKLDTSVLSAAVPQMTTDGVQSLWLHGSDSFSCALEGPDGSLINRQLNVSDCSFLLRPLPGIYRVRLWTLERPATVTPLIATRAIQNRDDGRAGSGEVSRARIPAPGRYETASNAFCLSEATKGLLLPCGGAVSLEAGPTLFAAPADGRLETSLRELAFSSDEPDRQPAQLGSRAFLQRHEASRDAIHLLRVSVPPGEQHAPACGVDGGITALHANSCLAASRVGRNAVQRWWAPQGVELEADVLRATAIVPSPESLGPGQRTLTWSGATARYDLPTQGHRVDLTLARDAWAVRLEGNGAVGDLCAAEEGMTRCVLSGRGGQLLLYSPTESRAEVTVVLSTELGTTQPLATVAEEMLPLPGTLQYQIAPAGSARQVRVEGALHCLLIQSDGARISGCDVPLAASTGATLVIDAAPGAVRASVGPADKEALAKYGEPLPNTAASWIPWSEAVKLSGSTAVHRSFTLDKEAVIHVRGDSGVCALATASDYVETQGAGGACEIHRLLAPGSYRLLARPFGRLGLTGTLSWTTEPVEVLKDGVGPEAWVSAGKEKLYRFTTSSAGKVGLGLQVPAETLDCTLLDAGQHVLGRGCQQYLSLDAGDFILSVRAPEGSAPTRFKPVIVGLAGARMNVPEEYLRDFFQRIGDAR